LFYFRRTIFTKRAIRPQDKADGLAAMVWSAACRGAGASGRFARRTTPWNN
jgi:hypothetical protein